MKWLLISFLLSREAELVVATEVGVGGLVFPSSACSIHAIPGHCERRYSGESASKVEYCDIFENRP